MKQSSHKVSGFLLPYTLSLIIINVLDNVLDLIYALLGFTGGLGSSSHYLLFPFPSIRIHRPNFLLVRRGENLPTVKYSVNIIGTSVSILTFFFLKYLVNKKLIKSKIWILLFSIIFFLINGFFHIYLSRFSTGEFLIFEKPISKVEYIKPIN